jgi:hypothetical protein
VWRCVISEQNEAGSQSSVGECTREWTCVIFRAGKQVVGAKWRGEPVHTRQWRMSSQLEQGVAWMYQRAEICIVTFGAGGAGGRRKMEECMDTSDSGDMLSLEQDGEVGRSRVEECPPMHKSVWMYHFWSRRLGHGGGVPQMLQSVSLGSRTLGHSGGVPINAPEGVDVELSEQEGAASQSRAE